MDAKPDFDTATRGVSEVIGSILVFGLVVLLLTILQTQAVPTANEQVEYEHSMEVQQDVSKLSSAVSQAATGQGQTVTVATGTGYPNRLVLFNPPPATGSLRSTDGGEVRLENFQAVDPEARDYLAGGSGGNAFSFGETHGFVYEPNYNRYQNAPATGYEHGVVYDEYDGDVRIENTGRVVSGRTISMTLLSGGLSASGQRTATVDTVPVSGPTETVQIRRDGGPVTVTLPTRLPEEVWVTEILAAQIDDTGDGNPALEDGDTSCGDITAATTDGDGRYVTGCSYGGDTITLTFQETENGEPVRYNLRTAKVGFAGSTPSSPSLDDYVVNVSPLETSTQAGESIQLRVEVRDEYNNPVAGTQVKAFIDEATTGGSESVERTESTDENGVAVLTYQPPSSGSPNAGEERDVIVTTDTDASNRQDANNAPAEDRVTFTVDVQDSTTSNFLTGPPEVRFVSAQVNGPTGGSDNGIQFTIENNGPLTSSVELTQVKVRHTSGSATHLLENQASNSQQWDYEVYVQKSSLGTGGLLGSSASAEAGGGEPTSTTGFPITSGTAPIDFSPDLTLEGSDQATYYLYAFVEDTGSGYTPVSMHDETVVVTVYYTYDGDQYTLTREIEFESS